MHRTIAFHNQRLPKKTDESKLVILKPEKLVDHYYGIHRGDEVYESAQNEKACAKAEFSQCIIGDIEVVVLNLALTQKNGPKHRSFPYNNRFEDYTKCSIFASPNTRKKYWVSPNHRAPRQKQVVPRVRPTGRLIRYIFCNEGTLMTVEPGLPNNFASINSVNSEKRRRMEAKGGGGEQMRRLHIVYFLSRTGRIEHPHLIRVHHLNRNGVYLRDVKRWLADLRGKDMPESFSWSYKRKYKTGYVWQDLLDDDLISPISDNEYVLQGSEISSINFDPSSHGEKKASIEKQEPNEVEKDKHSQASKGEEANLQEELESETTALLSTKTSSSEITEEESLQFSWDRSTLTEDSTKLEEENKHFKTDKQNLDRRSESLNNSSFRHSNQSLNKDNNMEKKDTGGSGSLFSSPVYKRSKSRSQSNGGASNIFRNLLTCGAIDTNDSVMVKISRSGKPACSNNSTNKISDDKTEICKGDKVLGGSCRVFGTSNWNHQPQYTARKSWDGGKDSKKQNNSEFTNQKAAVPAAYKPVAGPNCSQCGKPFKPEKMHAHMKSCKGLKALAKSAAAATPTTFQKTSSQRSMNSSKEPVPGYFLTR